jgi:hypothetical protein
VLLDATLSGAVERAAGEGRVMPSPCEHGSPRWRLGDRAGTIITRDSSPSTPSGHPRKQNAMNKYGRLAMSHWQRVDPARYAEIPEPKETFFQDLGEQAEREIQELEDAIAGSDPPGEEYLAKVGRLNAARQAAQERVLAELILIPYPDPTDPNDPELPAKTILQDVLEAIEETNRNSEEE